MPLLSLMRYIDMFQQYQNSKSLTSKTVEGDIEIKHV
jgi:hypothetical protein